VSVLAESAKNVREVDACQKEVTAVSVLAESAKNAREVNACQRAVTAVSVLVENARNVREVNAYQTRTVRREAAPVMTIAPATSFAPTILGAHLESASIVTQRMTVVAMSTATVVKANASPAVVVPLMDNAATVKCAPVAHVSNADQTISAKTEIVSLSTTTSTSRVTRQIAVSQGMSVETGCALMSQIVATSVPVV
jgi:hypothetical protein